MKRSIRLTIMTLTLLAAVSSYASPRAGAAGNRPGNTETRVEQNTRRGGQVAPGVAAESTAQGVIGNAARLRNEAARARQDAQRAEQANRQQAAGNVGAGATAQTPAQGQQSNAGGEPTADQMSAELRRSVTDAASLAGLDQLDAIRKNPNASADVRQRAEARILTGYQTCRGQTSCNFGGLDLAKLKDCTH